MRALALALAAAVAVSGCAGLGAGGGNGGDVLSQARGPEENRKLHTDLVRKMIEDERLYAALAHLDAQEKQFGATADVRLLRAEVLRKLDRTDDAEALYRELIEEGTFEGRAEHGLGLIHAPDDLQRGIDHFQTAVDLRPTDARIRNDLGYALMERGRIEDARLHLATAYQLESGGELSRNNYIVVLLLADEPAAAERVARKAGIGKKTMARLRNKAERLETSAGRTQATAADAPRIGAGGG